jgi:hypothetical protein
MFEEAEIMCIKRSTKTGAHERILAVGGVFDRTHWKLSQPDAIKGIEEGRWRLFVTSGVTQEDVIVARALFGQKYLKTEADRDLPISLLRLPECP